MSKTVYLLDVLDSSIAFGSGCYLYWAEMSAKVKTDIQDAEVSMQVKLTNEFRGDCNYAVMISTNIICGLGWAKDVIQSGAMLVSWHESPEKAQVATRKWLTSIVKASDDDVLRWNKTLDDVEWVTL